MSGAPEIEVTHAMADAGSEVLREWWVFLVERPDRELTRSLASSVYKAMVEAASLSQRACKGTGLPTLPPPQHCCNATLRRQRQELRERGIGTAPMTKERRDQPRDCHRWMAIERRSRQDHARVRA